MLKLLGEPLRLVAVPLPLKSNSTEPFAEVFNDTNTIERPLAFKYAENVYVDPLVAENEVIAR